MYKHTQEEFLCQQNKNNVVIRNDGVPFILKAGKALDSTKGEIRVQFKDVPGDIYKCVCNTSFLLLGHLCIFCILQINCFLTQAGLTVKSYLYH